MNWFTTNSTRLESHVRSELEPGSEQQRELAIRVLEQAVRRDEVAQDYEIIRRPLSSERISNFTSSLYAAAFSSNSVEQILAQAGALTHLISGADGAPPERGFSQLERKAWFAEEMEAD